MKKTTKLLSWTLGLTAFAMMNFASAAGLPTLITLYNSEIIQDGGNSTIAVLRQEPRKAELFSCIKRYTGDLKDFKAVEAFFNQGLEVFKTRTNCLPYNWVSGKTFSVSKNAIHSYHGDVIRYVFTGGGANNYLGEILSDVTTWTVDVNSDLGISLESEVSLVGARVLHSKLNTPTISTYRDSYKLSGIAQIEFSEIEK